MLKECSAKKWNRIVLITTFVALGVIAGITVFVDPFLHYHKPLSFLEYPLNDERYEDDGIARHYEYDAVIAGTSTSENFKTSQFNELWNATTIKQTYPGGTYYEIGNGLKRALKYNKNVKYVLWGLDLTRINEEADCESYSDLPEYLYDDNPFNDVSYVFNKDVVPKTLAVLNYTRSGQKTTSMDDYGVWYPWAEYGKDKVLAGLIDYSGYTEEVSLSDADYVRIEQNISENIVKLALDNADTEFYIFYTPSSAAFWYGMYMTKQLDFQIDAEERATEILLKVPNIHLYGFADRTDITGNLDNYMDTLHYSHLISNDMMDMIHEGEGLLTKDNYKAYYENIRKLYSEYPYDYR